MSAFLVACFVLCGGLVAGAVGGTITGVFGNEAHAWASRIAPRLVRRAARLRPESDRQDFEDENLDIVSSYIADGLNFTALTLGLNELLRSSISWGLPTWLLTEDRRRPEMLVLAVVFGPLAGLGFGVGFGIASGLTMGVFAALFGGIGLAVYGSMTARKSAHLELSTSWVKALTMGLLGGCGCGLAMTALHLLSEDRPTAVATGLAIVPFFSAVIGLSVSPGGWVKPLASRFRTYLLSHVAGSS